MEAFPLSKRRETPKSWEVNETYKAQGGFPTSTHTPILMLRRKDSVASLAFWELHGCNFYESPPTLK